MREEHYKELFVGRLKGELTGVENVQLDRHLDSCTGCRLEFKEMQQLWQDMEAITAPEPSSMLRSGFEDMLRDYTISTEQKKSPGASIIHLLKWRPQLSLMGQLFVILLAFSAGYFVVNDGRNGQTTELAELSGQVRELKQTMMLAMLENPSASERIKAVSFTRDITYINKEIIEALLTTLDNDPNVNVRLSTLDALTQLAKIPEVRQGLVQSITRQDSPMMQLAIAETMLQLQEASSVRPLQQLLKQKNLDEEVRQKVSKTINSII